MLNFRGKCLVLLKKKTALVFCGDGGASEGDFHEALNIASVWDLPIILHEDTLTGGVGGEIAAYISENLFKYLDGPVVRVASLDTAVPFTKDLEENFSPRKRFKEKLLELLVF